MTTSGAIFYVYEHWRLDRDECFYVGKGRGGRAYSMKDRNRHHQAIVAKLSRTGSAFEVRIVASGLYEQKAFDLERERIVFWRSIGVDLTNLTNGGEGISGFKHSEETRKNLSEKNKGIPSPLRGKPLSEETKKKISEIAKKRGIPKFTKEQQEKASNWHRGRKRSAETCAKISAKAKGRPASNKGKPSPLKGRKVSLETRKLMSEKAIETWAKRREKCGGLIVGRKLTDSEKLVISERKKAYWRRWREKQNGDV
ncbi:MAG: NUMOD3 domain-containing DNA-binding protein [Bryobacteraceae bacterium]